MRPSILVSNDDGIHSTGLHALADALREVGDVTVVAPDREKSASAHSLTLHRPVAVRQISDAVYTVDGTPADCVYLGALSILDSKPDLLVSGINRGGNIGDDVTYSGTVAAALEGTILGVPSFAVSQLRPFGVQRGAHAGSPEFVWDNAARVSALVARRILADPLPEDVLLNVNVPAGDPEGLRITRQGKHLYDQVVHEALDPRGKVYYWVGSGAPTRLEQTDDTDYTTVRQGFVSITPLHLDLTHRETLQRLKSDWEAPLAAEFIED
ncbi:MAG: 5'/3'-nucleotidase SurE [Acidobacteria bacterium]|nr:5'/3'-nucleotidase SurE [Acidobacteriota bacterium]